MTDTPLNPEPVAWKFRPTGAIFDTVQKNVICQKFAAQNPERDFVALYTQDQLDAAVRAERERCAKIAHREMSFVYNDDPGTQTAARIARAIREGE